MIRAELTEKILSQKRLKKLSWKTIVAEIGGGSPVYVTAALMGQMKLRAGAGRARRVAVRALRRKRSCCCRRCRIAARCRARCRATR